MLHSSVEPEREQKPWRRRLSKKALFILVLPTLVLGLAIVMCDLIVSSAAPGYVFGANPAEYPEPQPVALVLGTAKFTSNGRENLFYQHRIAAAADLYHRGLVRGIIVSGDNRHHSYNEPFLMREDLIGALVPPEHITCDYAGLDTFDSVHRVSSVFGQSEYIVISQKFHVERAVYIGRQLGHQVSGYQVAGPGGSAGWRVRAREMLARTKAVLEMTFTDAQPRHLGEPEMVGLR